MCRTLESQRLDANPSLDGFGAQVVRAWVQQCARWSPRDHSCQANGLSAENRSDGCQLTHDQRCAVRAVAMQTGSATGGRFWVAMFPMITGATTRSERIYDGYPTSPRTDEAFDV
jgi:hypothetical protein